MGSRPRPHRTGTCRCLTLKRERTETAVGRRKRATPNASGTSGARPWLGRDVLERLRVGERAQLLEALVLDLADPLARDVEGPPDLVERARVLAVEAVAQ